MEKQYAIERTHTYYDRKRKTDVSIVSYFVGVGKIIPCLEFTSKKKEATKYKTKSRARDAINFLGLESENKSCNIIPV